MGNSDNDILFMIIGATIVLLLLLCFIISFLFIYKTRQEKHKREMQQIREQYDQEILKTELEIREQTLKNISEEIHDNVGQVLSLAVLHLSALDVQHAAKAEQKIENITSLVKKAVSDLRNLSKTMDPSNIANTGLPTIIRFDLELLEKTGVYKTRFSVSGAERRLPASHETVIYRIVQESFNNIIKHAKAGEVTVALDFTDTGLHIEIADNGQGFDITAAGKGNVYKSGAGLKNMTNRAALIGATLFIKSVPSQGTQITMTVPYRAASHY